ncbi:MAG: metallophosphoesterase family protein [Acidimicrobiales bacterium]
MATAVAVVVPSGASSAETGGVTFAAIGDFGADSASHTAVADMIDGWGPDLIITVGDNRYDVPDYDPVVGKRYCDYMTGAKPGPNCGGGNSDENRFFPTLGNHDYNDGGGLADYLAYFTLPGNERYYDFVRGPVHFFAVDSGRWGTIEQSQIDWLRHGLQTSTAAWQVVYFHHAPYSSAEHGPDSDLQLDFAAWGADVVMAGHDHHYERIERDGIVYFVNGLGGKSRYGIGQVVDGSQLRYNAGYGAMLVTADAQRMTLEFRAIDGGGGQLIDRHVIDVTDPPPTVRSVQVRVAGGADDVEERRSNRSLYTNSSDLELIDDSDYQGPQQVGMRFRSLAVPQGAVIADARLRFVADESDSVRTDLTITGHDVGDSGPFSGSGAVSGRSRTAAAVSWSNIQPWRTGRSYASPDLSSVVQEIVDRGDWRSGSDLSLFIEGSGERTAESANGDAAKAPLLLIEYRLDDTVPPTTVSTTTTVPTTTTLPTTTTVLTTTTLPTTTVSSTTTQPTSTTTAPRRESIDVRIATWDDDVEEPLADNSLYRDSSDLELVNDAGYKGRQAVGLRFRNLDLPPGAVIEAAEIRFVADESDSEPTTVVIRGHDTGDSWSFSAPAPLTGRQVTSASATWSPSQWRTGQLYSTPDLSAVIQEIIDRGDWAVRNDLTLIITGSGQRTAESYNGDRAKAPLLHIEYRLP